MKIDESKSFHLNICIFILVSVLWSYGLNKHELPINNLLFSFLVTVLCFAIIHLFKSDVFKIVLNKSDIFVFLGAISLLTLTQLSVVTSHLGGDELYHAERGSILVRSLESFSLSFSMNSHAEYLSSIWNLFNPAHLPVEDLWRVISILFVITLSIVLYLFKLSFQTKSSVIKIFITLLGILTFLFFSSKISSEPEVHPPLRLLPLFISQTIFGLNSFAFRFPSIITSAIVALAVYKLVDSTFIIRVVASASSVLLPVIFYLSTSVEPSIFGYAAYTLGILSAYLFLAKGKDEHLIQLAIIASLGTLLRQSVFPLWLLVGILSIYPNSKAIVRNFKKLFVLGLIPIPYMISAKLQGHIAETATDATWHALLKESFVSGIGIITAINTTTIPWVFFAFLVFALTFQRIPKLLLLPFLLVIPVYCLFYTVWPYLWGIGRYQAEFIAPFIIYMIFLSASYGKAFLSHQAKSILFLIFIIVVGSTFQTARDYSLDINYKEWPKMKISTTAYFPYDQAFGLMKREELHGNFFVLGGSPRYGKIISWLSGFSYLDAKKYYENEIVLSEFLKTSSDVDKFASFCSNKDVSYVLIQGGTKREEQHRTPELQRLIKQIEEVPLSEKALFSRIDTFHGVHGGSIGVFLRRAK